MSNIPQARAMLEDLRDTLAKAGRADCAETVDQALALMTRRPLVRPRAPVKSRGVGPSMAAWIRSYAATHRNASCVDIAAHFGTNPGRVSEALHGDR